MKRIFDLFKAFIYDKQYFFHTIASFFFCALTFIAGLCIFSFNIKTINNFEDFLVRNDIIDFNCISIILMRGKLMYACLLLDIPLYSESLFLLSSLYTLVLTRLPIDNEI